MIGSVIGKYEILSEIGRGGMGIVYLGTQKSLNRKVAIKVLPPQLAADKDSVNRFIQEANLIAKLNHENIVQIYDIEEKDGAYYIIMEFLEGTSLDKIIHSKTLNVGKDKLIHFISESCKALECTHKQGIIHRDVKSANIFITNENKVKLMDFGISKMTSSTMQTMAAIGTPAYMSPEQARGEQLEPTSDIYSLGIVLYECLTGRLPFEGEDIFSVALKHINEDPMNPNKIDSSISPYLSRCCMVALNKNKDIRFHSAMDFSKALKGSWPSYLNSQITHYEKAQTLFHTLFDDRMFLPGMTLISLLVTIMTFQQVHVKTIFQFDSSPPTSETKIMSPADQKSVSKLNIQNASKENMVISQAGEKHAQIPIPEETLKKEKIEYINLLIESRQFHEASNILNELKNKFPESDKVTGLTELLTREKEKHEIMTKVDNALQNNLFDEALRYINYLHEVYPNEDAFTFKKEIIINEKQKAEKKLLRLNMLKKSEGENDLEALIPGAKSFLLDYPGNETATNMLNSAIKKLHKKQRFEKSIKVLEKARQLDKLKETESALTLISKRLKNDSTNVELLEYKKILEDKIQQEDFLSHLKAEERELGKKLQQLSDSFSNKDIESYLKLFHPEQNLLIESEKQSTLNLFDLTKKLYSSIQIIDFKLEEAAPKVSVFWKVNTSFEYSEKIHNLFEKQMNIYFEKHNGSWYIKEIKWVM